MIKFIKELIQNFNKNPKSAIRTETDKNISYENQPTDIKQEIEIKEANCPYCKTLLEKVPQRKKKCPSCNNFIYVRTLPSTRERVLATEEEARQIDAEWSKINFRNDWLNKLSAYGITEKDFNNYKDRLSKKFGFEASLRDVVRTILNDLILKISKKKDLHDLKMLYYEMALFLNDEGADSFRYLQEAAKLELMLLKKEGIIKKVSILSAGDACPTCQKLDGKKFTVDKALNEMPIPVKNCTFKFDNDKPNFCRCSYLAEL